VIRRAGRRSPGIVDQGLAFLFSVEAGWFCSAGPPADAATVTSVRRQNGLDSETIAVKPFGRVCVPNSRITRPSSR